MSYHKIKTPSFSRGFTLVELLVVIAIIGVLATLVLIQLGTARARARDAKRIADISQYRTAIELYFDDNGAYPINIEDQIILGPYFSSTNLPKDPSTGLRYGYAYNVNPPRYHIYAELERRNIQAFSADADINSTGWFGQGPINASVATTEANPCTTASTDCIYDLGVSQ